MKTPQSVFIAIIQPILVTFSNSIFFFLATDKLCSSLCKENVLEILLAAAETNNVELMRQVTVFLQDNRDLLKKPDVIEKVVKNLDKKNAKKLLDLVKGKF